MTTDTRPTKPITIDGVEHQIHIKPVLGDAGPYDLYDIYEVYDTLVADVPYPIYRYQWPTTWRWFRQHYQHGMGLYQKYKMAPFIFPSDERWTLHYVNEEGVYDFIDWVQSGEWNMNGNSVVHPGIPRSILPLEPGEVLCNIHHPDMDEMRANGATEEEIYQLLMDEYMAALPPETNE